MEQATIRIQSTTTVDNPLSWNEWQKKFKIGTRIQPRQLDFDMYARGEYNKELFHFIIKNERPPRFYERFFKN